MSSHARALADPWGLLLAGCAAAVGVAIHLPAVATVLVGVAVWVGRALVPYLLGRMADDPAPPDVEAGSPEALWLDRAIDAEADFDSLVLEGPLLAARAAVEETVTALYAIAETATALRRGGADPTDDLTVLEWATRELQDVVSHIAGLPTLEDAGGGEIAELIARLEETRQTVVEPSQVP
ncbi:MULTISPECIES: hypothetical protein [Actinokineospora]|uniref:Uncharacterized protein n=1 Tax=Actinokineospora fastidiosa TaxID=1816 RepID=A0A918L8C4_9PSEU|nr:MULTISPECIES: hypothetical protein [Actinokineospora]UVS76424.1 hypothetical protein Actkin_00111 [Actinokineospora sp. UTMC 2448]GGS18269.1 hypothetical protein GCM10010171_08500 [Actinokineospora fastidiosa]